MTGLGRTLDLATSALFALSGAALASMVALYLYEVAARHLSGAPTIWSAEAVGYALAVVIFAALPQVTRARARVAVDILPASLPEGAGRALIRITDAAAAIAASGAGAIVAREAWRQFERGLTSSGAVALPRWPVTALIALGLLLAAIHLVRHAARPPE